MPAFNAEKSISEAIESILGQSFADFEFLIIDDGSTDKTREIVGRYDDVRIKLVSRHHEGMVGQLNFGLSIVKSPVVARMDADDISYADRFQLQYEFLQQNPDIDIVSSSVRTCR